MISCDNLGPTPSFGPKTGADAVVKCFFRPDNNNVPAATVEWIVESAAQGDLVHVRLTLNPSFVDNTYGENAIGWLGDATQAGKDPKPGKAPAKPGMGAGPGGAGPGGAGPGGAGPGGPGKGGHTFRDLVGSDHAEFKLTDASGRLVQQFKADYLSESRSAPSGYATLGVAGGEGRVLVGKETDIVAVSTSLDRNLNACGLADYTVDSPSTDLAYTPNAAAPRWDYRVVYDVWVRRDAFGSSGFGSATVDFVHASPSKAGSHTIEVEPRDCPPDWPPYCTKPEGCCTIVDGSCVSTPPDDDEPACEDAECGPIGI